MPGMAPAPTPAGMPVPIGARAAASVAAKATASRAAECEPAQEARRALKCRRRLCRASIHSGRPLPSRGVLSEHTSLRLSY